MNATSLSETVDRPHPQSASFAWVPLDRSRLRLVTQEQATQFDEQGFFLYKNAFTPADIADITAAIDPLEEAQERRVREQGGSLRISQADAITFTIHLVRHSPEARAFTQHPVLKELCRELIGDDVRLYWDQSVYKKSGKPQEFPWHQDNGYTFTLPQQYITFWIPLVDVDEENGCPWIAPRRHLRGTLEHWKTETGQRCLEDVQDAVPVPAKAGDIVVFSSLAPHRTGPNMKAGSVRKAYVVQYAPDGARAYDANDVVTLQDDPDRQFLVLENGI